MSKTVLLVTGANGQLGRSLQQIATEFPDFDFVFFGSNELNVTDEASIAAAFERCRPAWCINAAAYTAVDKAETERAKAFAVNAEGVKLLADACKEYDAAMLHVSTDFVFAGNKALPLTEEDAVAPLNCYGESKLQGEIALQQSGAQYIIVRTSWLHSPYGSNFVKTMLRLGRERGELSVVADQIGAPTFAEDLARTIMTIVQHDHRKQPAYGLYHYSNEGVASWYDFAHAVFEIAGMRITLNPIPTSAYPAAVRRPHYSLMDKSKIKQTFGIRIPHWRESLRRCLRLLNAEEKILQSEANWCE